MIKFGIVDGIASTGTDDSKYSCYVIREAKPLAARSLSLKIGLNNVVLCQLPLLP